MWEVQLPLQIQYTFAKVTSGVLNLCVHYDPHICFRYVINQQSLEMENVGCVGSNLSSATS